LGPKPRKQWGKRADFGGNERKLQKLMVRKDELWDILGNFLEKLEETWELSWEHDDFFARFLGRNLGNRFEKLELWGSPILGHLQQATSLLGDHISLRSSQSNIISISSDSKFPDVLPDVVRNDRRAMRYHVTENCTHESSI